MTVQMREPTLQEMFADPIIRALMKADKVDESALEASVKAIARPRPPAAAPHGESAMTILRSLCRADGKAYCPA